MHVQEYYTYVVIKAMKINRCFLALLLLIVFQTANSQPSKNKYTQFWNEFAFTHGLKNTKFATELNIGQTWTSTSDHGSMFATNSQYYFRGWIHYYHSSRWKFSYFMAYYYNKAVPEI